MNSMDLLEVIGSIRDKYVADAGQILEKGVPEKTVKTRHTVAYRIAAVIALVLACILFLQTPIGAAAVEVVKESVSKLIESLFPPKDVIVMPEGMPEAVYHEAQGRDPDADNPGFVMYADTEIYVMTEEDGSYYVRPIPIEYDREEIRDQQSALLEGLSPEEQETAIDQRIQELKDYYASLPAVEIEIQEVPDKEFASYAQEVRDRMAETWDSATNVVWVDKPLAYTFSVSGGNEWNSPQEVHYFVDNGKQGTFHIVERYFLGAAEGHGMRFNAMIQTFTVVRNGDTAQYASSDDDLLKTMRQAVDDVKKQNVALLSSAKQDTNNQADLNGIAELRYDLWLQAMDTLWTALQRTLDEESMQDLLASQMEWSAYKTGEQNITVAEAGGGSLSSTVFYGDGADMLEQRVYYLLNVLEGTEPVQQRDSAVQLSPETVVSQFMKAYYSGDREAVKACLSESYDSNIDVYSDFEPANPEIHSIKGLDNLVHDMADRGVVHPSIEFRVSPDSDYFTYLSLTLTWENSQWKVLSYGLEG